ncbi:phosphonate transport system substrate-binding protein [Roseospira marina]|nr:phosphonate transport system substrate-binding protein [Roseospira marina]MBB5088682.1 phosphonate transport system substrate-binding protein [Roseospira marina]
MGMLKAYSPMVLHLRRALDRPVLFGSDTDMAAHRRALHEGLYDVVVTAPHFGAAMIAEGRYAPLLRYAGELFPILVSRSDKPIHVPADLKGKTLALPSRTSLVSMGAMRWLERAGLRSGIDVTVTTAPSQNAAVLAVFNGEAAAAAAAELPYRRTSAAVREFLRTIEIPFRVPHVFILARSDMPQAEQNTLRAALRGFETSPEGRAFLTKSGLSGFTEITTADVRALSGLVEALHWIDAETGP